MTDKKTFCPACKSEDVRSGCTGLVELGLYTDDGQYEAEQDGQYHECNKCGAAWMLIEKTSLRCPECDSLDIDCEEGRKHPYHCNDCKHKFKELY